MMNIKLWLPAIFPVLLACQQQTDVFQPDLVPDVSTGRWYSKDQLETGKRLFAVNCAICHGADAQGRAEWKKTDENGNFPPPPLNGNAHAWHHSLAMLGEVIKAGGQPMGGIMPAFKQTLSDEQILALISSFQSYWDQRTYEKWLAMEQQSRVD